ncbi:methyltransferase domain-containing protein [Telmatobacter sp. DSM 110680]|uniref:Methyltransferase domain-containing protein n=1 Tax=Telmatobacter sp. DSM 110680 TaxID=3036704 RepID=A0AAU7DI13_9BACT
MPPEVLDFRRRADLTELMDEPCSREEMRACLQDLSKLNRWFLGYRPILRWLDSLDLQKCGATLNLLDAGCGYGDTLRRIEAWSQQRGICPNLTGCDLNPDAVAIAAEASHPASKIQWLGADIFRYETSEPIDIVISSLFTHHLAEEDIVRFLQWMEENARIGWFINDLSRAPIPYHLLNAFSKLVGLHPFVKHDGPVSIRRAFVAEDWRRICAAAGLSENDVVIEGFTPARLCVARTKRRN